MRQKTYKTNFNVRGKRVRWITSVLDISLVYFVLHSDFFTVMGKPPVSLRTLLVQKQRVSSPHEEVSVLPFLMDFVCCVAPNAKSPTDRKVKFCSNQAFSWSKYLIEYTYITKWS